MLDVAGCGLLNLSFVKQKYCAGMHPDVKAGKRSEVEMQTDFEETFELHHKIKSVGSDKVTPEEFMDYYAHLSAHIDSDAYFELLLSNSWNLIGG